MKTKAMLATGKWIEKRMNNQQLQLCQRIAVLSRIKRFLPLEQRKAYYNVMIKQTIMYASTV
ncbi:unnamed protein product [Porites evermanni]|uniref:Uncharacterized protein n=1 Tax=Porites evermanni TaxID=104178 RepID=A0ABN8Q5R6_9CNID|nr:unnamed protein product [Porites evermanni]